jgi:hypothetical protein
MPSIPAMVALSLAALFGVIGIVQVVGPRFLHSAYRGWNYPPRLRLITAALDIAAAVLLAEASLRGWGIVLAAILIFGSVVTMLNHRQYACAVPLILMMAALVPATLAVPRATEIRFIIAGPQVLKAQLYDSE